MMIVNIILAFVMFGVALGIKTQTFKDVFTNPRSVVVGLLLQWGWHCLPLRLLLRWLSAL